MLLRTVVVASLLASWPMAARATVSTEQRLPTSASIPCRGQLEEHSTEGGDMQSEFYELSLTCKDAGKIAWTLRGSASSKFDLSTPGKGQGCSAAAMEPISSFIEKGADERVHTYKLVKYVFARNCDAVPIHRKNLQANTNAVRSDETKNGLLCKEITLVDGTLSKSYQDLKPELYKYVSVKTEGGPSEMEEDPDPSEVLGTQAGDSNYGISCLKGVLRRVDQ